MIEANPRASRTVPFVSKAIGAPLAKIACRLMLGERLADQELPPAPSGHVSVKEAVLPFARFAGADSVLGPEMKSTGEVMGDRQRLPDRVRQGAGGRRDLPATRGDGLHHGHRHATSRPPPSSPPASTTSGFGIIATRGTAQAISRMGVPVTRDQQDRRGLAARRRLHPQPRGRPGHQHPDRQRRALGRLRDPHRGRPPGDPLHDDDDRGLGGRAGDLRPARAGAEPVSLQELHDLAGRLDSSAAV